MGYIFERLFYSNGIWGLAFALALALLMFCRLRLLRWIMGLHLLAVALLLPAQFFGYEMLLWQGCEGDGGLKGLDCAQFTPLINLTILHITAMFAFSMYLIFVFPLVLIGTLIIELIARAR